MKKILLLAFLCIGTLTLFAQEALVEYSAAASAGTGSAATSSDANAVGLSRGSGINDVSGGTYNSNGWSTSSTSLANAISANDFLQFSFTPAPGAVIDLTNFDIRYDRSGNGPSALAIQISLDGFATAGTTVFSDATVSASGEDNTNNNLTGFSSLQGLESNSTVTFRLYAWNAGNNATFAVEPLTSYTPVLGGSNVGIVLRGIVQTPAPITLTSFTAKPLNQKLVTLDWITTSEENNDYFSIEHSVDGRNFESIGMVEGALNSQVMQYYSFEHDAAVRGDNYYRLRQVDTDGTYSFSSIEVVRIAGDTKVEVRPTLAESVVTISVADAFDSDVDLEVINILGQIVIAETLGRGELQVELSVADLQKGHYFVRMHNGTDSKVTRFIKR